MDKSEIYAIIKGKDKRHLYNDEDIVSAVDEIEQVIRNYCNIYDVPMALRYTVVNMSIDLLSYQLEVNKTEEDISLEEIDISDVSGIKMGDVDINIGQGRQDGIRKSILKSHKSNLDNIIMNYSKQLNQFRRIW